MLKQLLIKLLQQVYIIILLSNCIVVFKIRVTYKLKLITSTEFLWSLCGIFEGSDSHTELSEKKGLKYLPNPIPSQLVASDKRSKYVRPTSWYILKSLVASTCVPHLGNLSKSFCKFVRPTSWQISQIFHCKYVRPTSWQFIKPFCTSTCVPHLGKFIKFFIASTCVPHLGNHFKFFITSSCVPHLGNLHQ